MLPTKAKKLIPKVSELTEFPEDVCKKLIDFYYKQLRKKLSDLKYPMVGIENLGTFYVKPKVLSFTKENYKRMQIRMLVKPDSPRTEAINRELKEQLIKIDNIEKQYTEMSEMRRQKTVIQVEYNERKAKENLEGKVGDSTSNQEHTQKEA